MISARTIDILWTLAKTDFKLRYQGSFLGFFWALLKPLFIFLILNLVFSHFFAGQVDHYSLQLLMGILLWNYFSEGTTYGLSSLMNKSHILTKIAFPRWVVVVAACIQSLMTFIINLIILFGAFIIAGVALSLWQLLFFFWYLLLLTGIILGFSFFTAPLYVRYRDLNQIWEVLLLGGFYTAPVIYPLSALPEWLQPWLYINPMTFLIQNSKAVLFSGVVIRLDHHLWFALLVILGLIMGIIFFKSFERRVVEYL